MTPKNVHNAELEYSSYLSVHFLLCVIADIFRSIKTLHSVGRCTGIKDTIRQYGKKDIEVP